MTRISKANDAVQAEIGGAEPGSYYSGPAYCVRAAPPTAHVRKVRRAPGRRGSSLSDAKISRFSKLRALFGELLCQSPALLIVLKWCPPRRCRRGFISMVNVEIGVGKWYNDIKEIRTACGGCRGRGGHRAMADIGLWIVETVLSCCKRHIPRALRGGHRTKENNCYNDRNKKGGWSRCSTYISAHIIARR